jgi:hypothetical protein
MIRWRHRDKESYPHLLSIGGPVDIICSDLVPIYLGLTCISEVLLRAAYIFDVNASRWYSEIKNPRDIHIVFVGFEMIEGENSPDCVVRFTENYERNGPVR